MKLNNKFHLLHKTTPSRQRCNFYINYRNKDRESSKVKRQRNMFQVKEDKTSGKDFNATEISNISDKEFKLMVINVFTKVR